MMIRETTADDRQAVREVHARAFGQEAEAELVEALDAGEFTRVSLVAVSGTRIVGHVLFSDLEIAGNSQPVRAAALAPVAVLPEFQRQGIGSQLIREGLTRCGESGVELVFVLGDPGYYRRFGFSAALAERFDSPYAGEAFMALELAAGCADGLTGAVRYAPPFQDLE